MFLQKTTIVNAEVVCARTMETAASRGATHRARRQMRRVALAKGPRAFGNTAMFLQKTTIVNAEVVCARTMETAASRGATHRARRQMRRVALAKGPRAFGNTAMFPPRVLVRSKNSNKPKIPSSRKLSNWRRKCLS